VSGLPAPLLLLVFLASGAVIWLAGVRLSGTTDVIAERLHLGDALGGLILLAVATNLPEIAITASAALSGSTDVAVGNILGGIAVQTVVLVALDAFGVRERRPLTYQAASLVLVLEGVVVVVVLALVVAGSQLPDSVSLGPVDPAAAVIAVVWVLGLLLVGRAGKSLPWQDSGNPPDTQAHPRGHAQKVSEARATRRGTSTRRAALVFGVAALATLVAGVTLESSGQAFFGGLGMSGLVFGATVLAAATSLPELSTGLTSTRRGDYQQAVSDIFGGNAFLPVLFLLAALLSGRPVLPSAGRADVYLTALGAVLTLVYVAGLLFRPARDRLRMGPDSIVVLVVYVIGVVGLTTLTG